MLALLITVGSLIYSVASLQTSRYLVGQWKYKEWLKDSDRYPTITAKNYEDHVYRLEGSAIVGALLFSFVLLPIAAFVAFTQNSNANGQFAVEPKAVRRELKLKAAERRIEELELQTEVTK